MFRMPHFGKQLFFVLLSLADLTLTWALIRDGLGSVYESNPVAAWCLHWQGWAGLAVFKAIMVLLSIALSLAISRRRPRTGGRVLALGCAVTAGVVLYSSYLYVNVAAAESPSDEHNIRVQAERFAQEGNRVKQFLRLQDELADDLAEGRRCLADALAQFETAAQTRSVAWQDEFRRSNPAASDRQRFALRLMNLCMAKRRGQPQVARELAERLADEYRSLFGVPPFKQNYLQQGLTTQVR